MRSRLNSTGRSEISKTGTTKFGLRSSRDISASAPSGNEWVWFSPSEVGQQQAAKLEVTYCVPPTVTTVNAFAFHSTSCTFSGYLNNDGGEPCYYQFQWRKSPSGAWTDTGWAAGTITSGTYFYARTDPDKLELRPGNSYDFRAQCMNSAGTSSGSVQTFSVSTNDDNDASPEVGVEWIEHYDSYPNLPYSQESAEGFYNMLVQEAGWNGCFDYGDNNAMEKHFKRDDPDWISGVDNVYIDTVDVAWFEGHGEDMGAVLLFNVAADDFYSWQKANPESSRLKNEARWGDRDLEWIFINNCRALQAGSGTLKKDYDFGLALNGTHLICGFINDSNWGWASYDGEYVAHYLIDDPDDPYDFPYRVRLAWFYGEDEAQPAGEQLRVIGENSTCGEDYIWGQGTVCADPVVDDYLAHWEFTTY